MNVKEIDNKLVDKKYLEFPKKGLDDEEVEVINKGEVFTSISLNTKDKIKSLGKKYNYHDMYYLEKDNNLYVEIATRLYFSSFEVDDGIKYYQKNYIHYDS